MEATKTKPARTPAQEAAKAAHAKALAALQPLKAEWQAQAKATEEARLLYVAAREEYVRACDALTKANGGTGAHNA